MLLSRSLSYGLLHLLCLPLLSGFTSAAYITYNSCCTGKTVMQTINKLFFSPLQPAVNVMMS